MENFRNDVLTGLSQEQKTLSPKYLYDERGSELFEKITELEEYYPTRTEVAILRENAREIAELIGPKALIVEPGAGISEKIRILLPYLSSPVGYVPIEISEAALKKGVEGIHDDFPDLRVEPVVADYTEEFSIPDRMRTGAAKSVVFFPGSTIGNLDPQAALILLNRIARTVGHGGGALIGVDLKKDPETLVRAYDDAEGVTAAFDLNLLLRLNRELAANFVTSNFKHEARYNPRLGRIEMHLVSRGSQIVRVGGKSFHFDPGESIHTENSYKYSVAEFCALAEKAGFQVRRFWMDPQALFCVYYFETRFIQ